MAEPVVDRRFVMNPDEEGMELRLAVEGGGLHVVGIRNGKMGFLDQLTPDKMQVLGLLAYRAEIIRKRLGSEKLTPADVLAWITDEEYTHLVSPDPTNLGKVQVSENTGPFQVVGSEEV